MTNFEEEHELQIENIFTEDNQIDEIYEHGTPNNYVSDILENHYRVTTGEIEHDSNLVMALSEFHVNNLIFLKENFGSFPNSIHRKLLNLFNILLNLKSEKPKVEMGANNINLEEDNCREPDFAVVCKKKLLEIKRGFFQLNLVYNKSTQNANNFCLKGAEIAAILDYIKTFYFPFIRLYYHFINIQKITENKKIEIIVNMPLSFPALSLAVMQVQEKNLFEEQKENTDENHTMVHFNNVRTSRTNLTQIKLPRMSKKKLRKNLKPIKT